MKFIQNLFLFQQLEEIVIQKCCEMISDSSEIGELRRQVTELQQAEFYRKQKILNLEKQVNTSTRGIFEIVRFHS